MSSRLSLGKLFSPYVLIFQSIICCLIFVLLFKHLHKIPVNSNKEIVFVKYFVSEGQTEIVDDWHSQLNDDSLSTFQIFFRHATSDRNSSYPFVSGDTFRALADHIFDETTDVSKWPDRIWEIGRGDIVFVQAEKEMLAKFFFNDTFNRIRHPFVLVTHNSDASVPPNEYQWVLYDKRILGWFTQNPSMTHAKLFPVPIGVANTRWPHGNVIAFKRAFYLNRKPFHQRKTLLYVNFQVGTNKEVRSKALAWALNLPNVKQTQIGSVETYLEELGNAKFVLSPPGNGLDCHRTWEALLMGAVPIVLTSHLDSLFLNQTVLIVEDWNQITLEYLQSLDYKTVPSHLLLAKYWYRRLLRAAGRI